LFLVAATSLSREKRPMRYEISEERIYEEADRTSLS
jgi:hypothetical protein